MALDEFTVKNWKDFVGATVPLSRISIDVTTVRGNGNILKTTVLKGEIQDFDEIYVDCINVDETGVLHLYITIIED